MTDLERAKLILESAFIPRHMYGPRSRELGFANPSLLSLEWLRVIEHDEVQHAHPILVRRCRELMARAEARRPAGVLTVHGR